MHFQEPLKNHTLIMGDRWKLPPRKGGVSQSIANQDRHYARGRRSRKRGMYLCSTLRSPGRMLGPCDCCKNTRTQCQEATRKLAQILPYLAI